MKKLTFSDFIIAAAKGINFQINAIDGYCSGELHWIKGGVLIDMLPVFLAELAAAGLLGLFYVSLQKSIGYAYTRIMRPKYYPQENARRRSLAAERRKIRRRTTLNAAPTAADLLEQYAKIKRNPKEMIRFGSMLCDLEAYVDNSLVRDENGMIIGRRPGIKGWLAEHCPEMHARYKTIIRYKALAEKFRQAVGLADPHPAAEAFENETTVRNSYKSAFYKDVECLINEAGKTEAGLIAALGRRLDPVLILDSPLNRARYSRMTLPA